MNARPVDPREGGRSADGLVRALAERPSRIRYWVLAVFCSLGFLTYLDRICIMRVQGDIERDLRLAQLTADDEARLAARGLAQDAGARAKLGEDRATARMSWVFAAFLFGYLLLEVPGGWMGDRWGVRRVILRMVLAWSVFTALTGAVPRLGAWLTSDPSPELLLALLVTVRFLFGLGEAGAYPNVARALGRWFPFRERALAQGAIWFAGRLGGAAAPAIIGSLMAIAGNWQRAFATLGVIGIGWAVFFGRWFRDRPEEKASVNEAERRLIQSGSGSGHSIYEEADSDVPWRELVRSRTLLALYAVSFSMSFCWYFFVTFLPRYLRQQHGIEYADSQIVSGLPLLAGGVACLAGGKLSDWLIVRFGSRRWGRSLPGLIGCVLALFCALAATRARVPSVSLLWICLASACQDLSLPCMWSVPVDVGGRHAGTVGGCMNSMGCLGGMLSPLVAARISAVFGWSQVFYAFAAIYLCAAVAWALVDASRPLVSVAPLPERKGRGDGATRVERP